MRFFNGRMTLAEMLIKTKECGTTDRGEENI